jgi:hypothetical protein
MPLLLDRPVPAQNFNEITVTIVTSDRKTIPTQGLRQEESKQPVNRSIVRSLWVARTLPLATCGRRPERAVDSPGAALLSAYEVPFTRGNEFGISAARPNATTIGP